MFFPILTLTLCLTTAFVHEHFRETSLAPDPSQDPIYNVNAWVKQLQLQRCALVAVGLKNFAIFVEDEILEANATKVHRMYFLGLCQQEVLEQWKFCSTRLAKKRKYKCRFRLKDGRFQPRVHRRFCDFKVMVKNKDCKCAPTIFGDNMIKVKGFPTCYIPPLPSSLCKYNTCGLNQCTPVTVDESVHTVNCTCKGKNSTLNPFCEHPKDKTSRFPAVRSVWSKWEHTTSESRHSASGKKLSAATCINKYTERGGLDCLGPGTGCCPRNEKNCTCETFEDKGVLKVQRIIYPENERSPRSLPSLHPSGFSQRLHYSNRCLRDTNNDDDIEDDDDDEDDLDEDIKLEENPEEETTVPTTEDLEKEEVVKGFQKDAVDEFRNATNASMVRNNSKGGGTFGIALVVGSLCFFLDRYF